MLKEPFFNPRLSYDENWDQGPFGLFRDGKTYSNRGEPKFTVFGHPVYLPFGIPAGPLLNGKFIKAALDKGFDIPMYKTVRTRSYPSHPWPNVLPLAIHGDLTLELAQKQVTIADNFVDPISITNSFGNPSRDPDVWQKDIADSVRHAKNGQIVAASIEGTWWEGYSESQYLDDWALGAHLIVESGAHIVEANLSCPNEGTTSLVCFDVTRSKNIAYAIKKRIGNTPLLVKIAYYSDSTNLHEFVKEVGSIVDGISAINTISAEIVDRNGKQALPGDKRKRSGVCGAPIKWAGLDMVRRLKRLRDELGYSFLIVGVGGVTTASDYREYRTAGADIVMSATGAMWNPKLAIEIKQRY